MARTFLNEKLNQNTFKQYRRNMSRFPTRKVMSISSIHRNNGGERKYTRDHK